MIDRLPVLSQDEVHEVCQPHYPLLWHTIMDPWERFLEYRESDENFTGFSEGETAQWLTIQATRRARHLLSGAEGVRFLMPHGKLVIVLQDTLAIAIKKLRRRFNQKTRRWEIVRSNYLTMRNQSLWNQERGEDFLKFPRLILGYMFNPEITQITPMLAYPRSRRLAVDWALEIPSQADLHSDNFAPRLLAPTADDQPTFGFQLSPADDRDEERDTGSE